jgi:single-strand DNA-binding protein
MPDTTLVGNIVRDPELRYTNNDKAFATFTLARNRGTDDNKHTDYIDVLVYDGAENVAESLTKGLRVIVSGRLEYVEWQGKDGSTQRKHRLVGYEVGPSLKWAKASVERV